MRQIRPEQQRITVTLVRDAVTEEMRPVSFYWPSKRSTYQVRSVIDQWQETGRWWDQEAEATIWRVQLHDQGMMELAQVGQVWRLLVVWD